MPTPLNYPTPELAFEQSKTGTEKYALQGGIMITNVSYGSRDYLICLGRLMVESSLR